MHVFKYMMKQLHTRVKEEWQDLDIPYPQWLTHIVLDDVYYTAVLIIVCANAFAVGLVIGWLMTIV
jgi:tetrahydromethanopterin S-methyltransferase subunit B